MRIVLKKIDDNSFLFAHDQSWHYPCRSARMTEKERKSATVLSDVLPRSVCMYIILRVAESVGRYTEYFNTL